MKAFGKAAVIIFAILLNFSTYSKSCDPRDEDEAIRQDPTRTCRKECETDADCKGDKKTCMCDNLCGLSCFNKDANCTVPNSPENGNVKTPNGISYGKKAKYSCLDGYKLNGTDVRTCRSDKMWSLSEPICVHVCPPPAKPSYAYPITNSADFYIPGYIITYKCRTSHLGADSTVTCQNDYQWSPLKINCVKKTCGYPGNLDNGYYEGTDFSYAKQVIFKCNKGYYMVGGNQGTSHRRLCRSSGWDGDLEGVSCEAVNCGAPEDLENGVIDTRFAPNNEYSEQIFYSCNTGFQLVGPDRGRCNENGTWGERPICKIDVTCKFSTYATPTCGYTVSEGDLERVRIPYDPEGLSNYVLSGKGILQSVQYPIGNETKCLKFDYRTIANNAIHVKLVSPDGSQDQMPASTVVGSWDKYETRVKRVEEDDTTVRWDIVIEYASSIDNIELLDASQCPPATATPATTSSSTTSSASSSSTVTVSTTTIVTSQSSTRSSSSTSQVHETHTVGGRIGGEGSLSTESTMTSQSVDIKDEDGGQEKPVILYVLLPLGICLALLILGLGCRHMQKMRKVRSKQRNEISIADKHPEEVKKMLHRSNMM